MIYPTSYKLHSIGVNINSVHPGLPSVDMYILSLCDPEEREKLKNTELDYRSTIACTVNFLDGLKDQVDIFKEDTGKDVNILFLNTATCNIKENIKSIEQVKNTYPYIDFGLLVEDKCSVDKLEDFENEIDYITPIRHYALNINPTCFNLDVLDYIYCYGEGSVIGLGCLGNKFNKELIIDSFTRPYLLEFASYYCDAIILDGEINGDDIRFLSSLFNKSPNSINVFKLSKNIYNQFIPSLNRMITTSLWVSPTCRLVLDDLKVIPPIPSSIRYTFGLEKDIIPEEDMTDLESEFTTAISEIVRPSDDVDFEGYKNLVYHKAKSLIQKKIDDNKKSYSQEINTIFLDSKSFYLIFYKKELEKKYFIAPNKYKDVPTTIFISIRRDGTLYIKEID